MRLKNDDSRINVQSELLITYETTHPTIVPKFAYKIKMFFDGKQEYSRINVQSKCWSLVLSWNLSLLHTKSMSLSYIPNFLAFNTIMNLLVVFQQVPPKYRLLPLVVPFYYNVPWCALVLVENLWISPTTHSMLSCSLCTINLKCHL